MATMKKSGKHGKTPRQLERERQLEEARLAEEERKERQQLKKAGWKKDILATWGMCISFISLGFDVYFIIAILGTGLSLYCLKKFEFEPKERTRYFALAGVIFGCISILLQVASNFLVK